MDLLKTLKLSRIPAPFKNFSHGDYDVDHLEPQGLPPTANPVGVSNSSNNNNSIAISN